jgi:hypothetical protein
MKIVLGREKREIEAYPYFVGWFNSTKKTQTSWGAQVCK